MAESIEKPQSWFIDMEDEPLLVSDVLLEDVIEGEDDTFRTQNTSMTDFERRNIIERTGGDVQTRVVLQEVTHGTYDDEEDGDEATILVFCFRFDPQTTSSRVHRALISIEFFASKKSSDPPIVDMIAPDGCHTVLQTTDEVSVTKGGELGLGASVVVEATAKANMTTTTTRHVGDAATVTGSINLGTGKNKGDSTVAAWNLLENKRHKTGVVRAVRVSVLLRRTSPGPFHAIVTLKADCDFATGLKQKLKNVPLDDPILFDPSAQDKKPKKGRHHGVKNLSNVPLDFSYDPQASGGASRAT